MIFNIRELIEGILGAAVLAIAITALSLITLPTPFSPAHLIGSLADKVGLETAIAYVFGAMFLFLMILGVFFYRWGRRSK